MLIPFREVVFNGLDITNTSLEDSKHDSELVHHLLLEDGIDCEIIRCENREKFLQGLEKKNFDLIFADCTLPQFNGIHALELAVIGCPKFLSSLSPVRLREDSAIESLRRGATDYVLKSRLSRLVPAVRRAISEAQEKAKSQEMEQRLRQAQRLEAVGTLAGGIAPISTISSPSSRATPRFFRWKASGRSGCGKSPRRLTARPREVRNW